LLGPHANAHVIEDILQGLDTLLVEAAAEVARRGRIGNAQGSQGIQKTMPGGSKQPSCGRPFAGPGFVSSQADPRMARSFQQVPTPE